MLGLANNYDETQASDRPTFQKTVHIPEYQAFVREVSFLKMDNRKL